MTNQKKCDVCGEMFDFDQCTRLTYFKDSDSFDKDHKPISFRGAADICSEDMAKLPVKFSETRYTSKFQK